MHEGRENVWQRGIVEGLEETHWALHMERDFGEVHAVVHDLNHEHDVGDAVDEGGGVIHC
jgi:hypothetical protein